MIATSYVTNEKNCQTLISYKLQKLMWKNERSLRYERKKIITALEQTKGCLPRAKLT